MRVQPLLNSLVDAYRRILGEKLTGLYLHGSLAFGCFTWETGDIDFLAVVEKPLTQLEKEAILQALLALTPLAPPKGLEMSVVLRQVCKPFVYPTPFELHFSNSHLSSARADPAAFCRAMHGTDPDLAAHFTVTAHVGRVLCGLPVAEVFGPVPRSAYVDSILADVEDAAMTPQAHPAYLTLNLCRVLAYLTDGLVLSKRQGGEWALTHLPGHQAWIQRMLAAYAGSADPISADGLEDCTRDLLSRIRTCLDRSMD